MQMRTMNLERLRNRYGGQYVALFRGRVVKSARSHSMFVKKILPVMRTKRLELMFVPPKGVMRGYSVQA